MRKHNRILQISLIAIVFQSVTLNLIGQNASSGNFNDVFGFGKSLYFEKDYKRAIAEFQIALRLNDLAGLNYEDSINYLTGMAYSRLRNYNLSNHYLLRINSSSSKLFESAILQTSKNLIVDNQISAANLLLKNHSANELSDKYARHAPLLIASGYLLLNAPESAYAELTTARLPDSQLYDIALEMNDFKPRSQLLAGLFSAIVPGTGKFYSRNFEDGLMSMFTIGLFGFRTATEYRNSGTNSVSFWVFGLATLYFYSGNVYGSAVSAKIYNETFYSNIRNNVLEFIEELD